MASGWVRFKAIKVILMVSIKEGEASSPLISLGGLVKDTLGVDDGGLRYNKLRYVKLRYIQVCPPSALA